MTIQGFNNASSRVMEGGGEFYLNLSYNTNISCRNSPRAISSNYVNNLLISKGTCKSTTLQDIWIMWLEKKLQTGSLSPTGTTEPDT